MFPTADAVTLVPKWPGGPFSGRCSLQFSSVAEVESVVSQQVMVKGQAVQAYVAGLPPLLRAYKLFCLCDALDGDALPWFTFFLSNSVVIQSIAWIICFTEPMEFQRSHRKKSSKN